MRIQTRSTLYEVFALDSMLIGFDVRNSDGELCMENITHEEAENLIRGLQEALDESRARPQR